jgi:cytochrome bd ubiquinol oxidase subunit I
LVAIGSNISALWILIANSFMQEPVGYTVVNGRAQMTNFFALLTNPNVLVQYPHVLFSGLVTAAFFILGISAFHFLRRKNENNALFKRSFQLALGLGLASSILVGLVGHTQAQHMVETQPMKMAAAEALWNTEDPASLSIFTIGNLQGSQNVFSIRIPDLLSILSFNSLQGEVKGINELQAEYVQQYGSGDYVPPVPLIYWSFRIMVGAGAVMILLALYGLYLSWRRKQFETRRAYLYLLLGGMALPFLANSAGWIMTEVGRQPWIVYGLLTTAKGVSPTVNAGSVLFSLIAFALIYGVLMGVDIFLLAKYAKINPLETTATVESEERELVEVY